MRSAEPDVLSEVRKPPLPTQVRARDAKNQVITEGGTRSEICVRGQNVTRGYWSKPEATAAALEADGWFRTATWATSTSTASGTSATASRT